MDQAFLPAFNDVKYNKLSLSKASTKYGIPKTTLQRWMKNPLLDRSREHLQTFCKFDEDCLAELLRKYGEFGVTITTQDFLQICKDFVTRYLVL
jgi:helix-turn-helix, Psq domain